MLSTSGLQIRLALPATIASTTRHALLAQWPAPLVAFQMCVSHAHIITRTALLVSCNSPFPDPLIIPLPPPPSLPPTLPLLRSCSVHLKTLHWRSLVTLLLDILRHH
jgi:hypothetical protein